MNSLVILPSEVLSSTRASLEGERAVYAYGTHGVREGCSIKVAVLGGMRGEGTVLSASSESVTIELALNLQSLDPIPVTLIVGVSRPQTIKKVIQSAVMFGVTELHFVRSELGEKSYLQSKALDPANIQDETIKALEQVWDSRPPSITVHRSLFYFMEYVEPKLKDAYNGDVEKLLAHPGGCTLGCIDATRIKGRGAVVAIGPERGWSVSEIELFCGNGFATVGLGERVVRVELALVYLLGKLSLLRE